MDVESEVVSHGNNRMAGKENRKGLGSNTKMRQSSIKIWIIHIVGLIIAILGIVTGVFWSSIYNIFFTKEFSLTPTSISYGIWKETPIPMYFKLYLFNWTNSDNFNISNGIKPNFVEMGPYVFRQVDYKVNQVWNENGTITFQRRKVWHFEESMSAGKLSDKVTNLNPVTTTIAYSVRNKTRFVRDIVNRIIESVGEQRVITKTVKELLFDGYHDEMLSIAHKIKPSLIPYNKFGWFYGRNGSDTYDGTFNMLTGVNGLYDLGMIKEWNFSNRSEYYEGQCGVIRGSNGDLWPPLPNNESISIFASDICTSLALTYENTTTFQGLKASRFISDESMLDNGTNVLSRRCYCSYTKCIPSGMLDVSMCKYGAPAFISLPHFYLADPIYNDAVTGLNANKEEHEMSLLIEPTTGVPLQVKARMQINLLVQPDDRIRIYQNINKTYIPMIWFSQEANLTSNFASKIKLVLILPSLGVVTAFGVAGIGILIVFIGLFVWIRQRWYGEENQVLISKNENHSVNADD